MAVSNTQNPITSTLLDIWNTHLDRRQAEIDLQRAQARENFTGKTAIPNVMAQLKMNHEKEQARREKIQKQGEQQAPPPESMVPPMTEVDGRANARSAAPALAAAGAAIASIVSGGRGVKTGQVGPSAGLPPGIGGQNPVLQGQQPQQTAQNIPQPPTPQQPQTPVAAPAGPTQAIPAGTQGSVVPVNQKLGALDRYLIAPLKIVGGIATKSPGTAIEGVSEITKGEKTIDYQRVPTDEEVALKEAPTLAGMLQNAKDKAGTAEGRDAEQQLRDQIDDMRKRVGDGPTQIAIGQAQAAVLAREHTEAVARRKAEFQSKLTEARQKAQLSRKEAIKAADPEEKNRDRLAVLIGKVGDGYVPTPPERAFMDEMAKTDWKSRIMNQISGGATPTTSQAATPQQAQQIHDELLQKLGHEPGDDDITAEILKRGLRP